jgi:hypothetical protein
MPENTNFLEIDALVNVETSFLRAWAFVPILRPFSLGGVQPQPRRTYDLSYRPAESLTAAP